MECTGRFWVVLHGRGGGIALALLALAALAAAGNVGIVVQYDDSRVEARCVAVSDGETAADALARSGFSLAIADFGWGNAVCGISGVGCPASNCWCGGGSFWSLKQKSGGSWSDASVGISDVRVNGGDTIGLRWGAFGSLMADAADPCAAAIAGKRGKLPDVEVLSASFIREGCRLVGVAVKSRDGGVVPFALVRVLAVGNDGVLHKVAERESDGGGSAVFGELANGTYLAQVFYPNAQPFEENVNAVDCGEGDLTLAFAQRIKEPERKDIKQFVLVDMVRHALASFEDGRSATGWIHTGWGENKRW